MRLRGAAKTLGLFISLALAACSGGTVGTGTRPPRSTMFDDPILDMRPVPHKPAQRFQEYEHKEDCERYPSDPRCATKR